MSYFQDKNSYLLIFDCVNNAVVANSNTVVIILIQACHLEVLEFFMTMWHWVSCQIAYLFEYPILHLGRNTF